MAKRFITIGSILGLMSIALGAFGAHALESRLTEAAMETYHTGVEYQMYHAIALVLAGILAVHSAIDERMIRLSGIFFITGVVLFSGSLYAVSLLGISLYGIVAPFGGFSMMLGWLFLVLSVRKIAKKQ